MTTHRSGVAPAGEPAGSAASPAPASSRKHVVMLAGNDITSDARVLKYLATMARFGLEVTAVGLCPSGPASEVSLGDVRVIRVPVRKRAQATGVRARRRQLVRGVGDALAVVRPWFWTKSEYHAALGRWEQDSREVRADQGRARRDALRTTAVLRREAAHAGVVRTIWLRGLRVRRVVLAVRARPLRWRERAQAARQHPGGVGRTRAARLRGYRAMPSLARWRQVLPEVVDQDLAVGPVLDRLRPDVLHVHDVFMLGVAARAAHRAAMEDRHIPLLYDAHEYLPGLAVVAPRRVAAYCDLEQEFIVDADRVITVSDPLADALQRDHGLAVRPDVVLNAPVADDPSVQVKGVREHTGLADEVPLLVYGGGVNRARGVQTVVEALQHLPSVHLVVVAKRASPVTSALRAKAKELGVAGRLHFAPFVPPESVPRYFASATAGVSPLLHSPNHDMAITNKFCEYLAGGLPIITSDTPAQAELVEELDLGAVHVAGDSLDCARAIRAVLDDLPRLRSRIAQDAQLRRRFGWPAQAEKLRDIYTEVLGELPAAAWSEEATHVRRLLVHG